MNGEDAGNPQSPTRTPVIVGVGQVLQRLESLGETPARKPLSLMELAARAAAEDARCPKLLSALDSIRVPRGLWPYSNPARVLADRLGSPAAQTATGPISGNMVQRMLNDAAREIVAGRRDAVLIVGAEGEHSKRRAKRAGRDPGWSTPETPPPDRDFDERDFDKQGEWILQEEVQAGLAQAAAIFSLYENARRHARGESLEANRDRIAALWHDFAKVAERNPFAWTREAPDVGTIREATDDNRMITWPYTVRLCSNMVVDQGAAVIVCSTELADRLDIPRDRRVFLSAATDCGATPPMSHRMDFLTVPALGLAGRRALELAGLEPADLDHVDLYSCFPAAVQVAAEALDLSPERPLTVTGGLAYAGGPLNSYVLHAIATTVAKLREKPGRALVSSVGGAFQKHAFGIYASEPGAGGFQYADLDPEAARLPRRERITELSAETTVETYALRYEAGRPAFAAIGCLTGEGQRSWTRTDDPEILQEMESRETCGRRATLVAGKLQKLV